MARVLPALPPSPAPPSCCVCRWEALTAPRRLASRSSWTRRNSSERADTAAAAALPLDRLPHSACLTHRSR